MLKHLTIHNYALITDLDITFESGFSVITGETGAGKSIILGALALLMGARADIAAITEGEQKCVIEGEFDLTNYGLESLFEEAEIDYSSSCIIRRELLSSGKSRSFVNDTPITLAMLKSLASKLIDIHSQHQNLLLSEEGFCLGIIDSLAENQDIAESYSKAYQAYRETENELTTLRHEAAMSQKDADYIQYQYNQLYEAQLEAGELEELELEQRRLANAEDILSYLKETQQELNGDENSNGAIMGVRGAQHALQHISEFLHPDENLLERLESAYIELKDIANSIESQLDETDADPEQLQITEERIGLIHGLLRKYDVETEDELIALRDKLEQQIGRCDSYDFEIEQLEKRLSERLKTLKQAAKTLTASRKAVEPMLKQKMESMLTQLGIAHAQIGLRLTPLPDFSETGQDDVTILFAANLGQTPRPVSDIASGGEMARIMLSIKALVADKKGLPTIIFDEVDTGLSGEVASHMGGIMSEIAHERQVLSITHLPQIAALGNHHYKVYKQDTDVRTETHIRRLAENERAEEIAMLLSDTHITPEAIENAKRLLKKRNENEVP